MTQPKDSIEQLTQIIVSIQETLQDEFDRINGRLDVHDDLFEKMGARFERLEGEMREGFDRVNTTLDGIADRLDIDDTERVALSAEVTRHEDRPGSTRRRCEVHARRVVVGQPSGRVR